MAREFECCTATIFKTWIIENSLFIFSIFFCAINIGTMRILFCEQKIWKFSNFLHKKENSDENFTLGGNEANLKFLTKVFQSNFHFLSFTVVFQE